MSSNWQISQIHAQPKNTSTYLKKWICYIYSNTTILGCSPDGNVIDPSSDSFGLMAVKCPETKFQVSPLDGWCLDPKFFCESVGNMCQLKEPMLTMPKFRAKWAVLVHNGVTFLFTPKKECQLKELPLTEVTGLSFRRSFVSSISHISLIMLQLNLHHHVQKQWWIVIL